MPGGKGGQLLPVAWRSIFLLGNPHNNLSLAGLIYALCTSLPNPEV